MEAKLGVANKGTELTLDNRLTTFTDNEGDEIYVDENGIMRYEDNDKRKTLNVEDMEGLVRREHLKNFYYSLMEDPNLKDWYKVTIYEDYQKIKANCKKLIELIKPLIKDPETDITILNNDDDIYAMEELVLNRQEYFVYNGTINEGQPNQREEFICDLYLRNYIPENDRKKNRIVLLTNLFKVTLNPDNPTHLTFMKKITDLRTNLFYKDLNTTEAIRDFVTLLKYTFSFSKITVPLPSSRSTKMTILEKSITDPFINAESSTSNVVRNTEDFFDYFEDNKLITNSMDIFEEFATQFITVLSRTDEVGLEIYKDWKEELFSTDEYVSQNKMVTFDYTKFKDALSDYCFDDVFDEIEEDEDGDYEYKFLPITFKNSYIKERLKNGIATFLTYELCFIFDLNDPKDTKTIKNLYSTYQSGSSVSERRNFKNVLNLIFNLDEIEEKNPTLYDEDIRTGTRIVEKGEDDDKEDIKPESPIVKSKVVANDIISFLKFITEELKKYKKNLDDFEDNKLKIFKKLLTKYDEVYFVDNFKNKYEYNSLSAIFDNFTNEITYKKKDGSYDVDYEVIEQSYTDNIDLAMFISAHCVEAGTPDVVEYFWKNNKPTKTLIKFLMFVKDNFETIFDDSQSKDIDDAIKKVQIEFKKENKDIDLIKEHGDAFYNVLYAFLNTIINGEQDEKGKIIDVNNFTKTIFDHYDEKDYKDFILNNYTFEQTLNNKYKNLVKFLIFVKKNFQTILADDDVEDVDDAFTNIIDKFNEENNDIDIEAEYINIFFQVLVAFVDAITNNKKDEGGDIIDIIDFKKTKYDELNKKDYFDFILYTIKKNIKSAEKAYKSYIRGILEEELPEASKKEIGKRLKKVIKIEKKI